MLAKTEIALTLHAALALCAFAQPVPRAPLAPSLEMGRPAMRNISPGEIHGYRAALRQNHLVRFAVQSTVPGLQLRIIGPLDQEQVLELIEADVAVGGQPTVVEFVAKSNAEYTVRINAVQVKGTGVYELKREDLGRMSPGQIAALEQARKTRLAAGTAWLKENAIPLAAVEAGHGFRDLQRLRPILGKARVVALGEATHGAREFFQLKHRLFEFLVKELGFTVFAFEAPMAESFDVNRYVLTGEGDPVKALTGLYLWPWINEEVLELIRWMRNYNADARNQRKVKFYGIDMQHVPRAANRIVAYLRHVDAEAATTAARQLVELTNPITAFGLPGPSRKRIAPFATDLQALFDERKADWVRRSSLSEWTMARQQARLLATWVDLNPMVRDRGMAENVAWILQQDGPEARIAVWAHNAHVQAHRTAMGNVLKGMFGDGVVTVGFTFNQGGFMAMTPGDRPAEPRLGEIRVGPAPAGTLDAALAATGHRVAAVPLNRTPAAGPVAEWFRSNPPRQEHGAEATGASYVPLPSASAFDLLLFVENTHAARTLAGGRQAPIPVLAAPSNLDFESGLPGQVPPGWIASPPGYWQASMQLDFGWRAAASGVQPRSGRLCAEVGRFPGNHYGESAGGIAQRIDASAFQGKHVRLRAAVRAEVDGAGNQAHLWLRISGGNYFTPLFFNAMLDNPITAGQWRTYEIVGAVPQAAKFIDYGLAMVGVGKAWIDDVSIEALEGSN